MRSTRVVSSFSLLRAFVGLLALAGCAKSTEKSFQPVVVKIGQEVRAISAEEANTLCVENYCEENQLYVAHFGRKKPEPAPAPVPTTPQDPPAPTTPPTNLPPQPAQQNDYSRAILNLPAAWKITEGSPEVTVAVVDTGVDYFHPDLRDNIAVNSTPIAGFPGDTYGWDFYHERANGFDDAGHGTHCAGIIGAVRNSIGIVGVAPKVKILPVKFMGANGAGDTADAVRAIDYAVARGAKVISNSWGGGGYSKLLDDAIQRAINRGVIVLAAAGNDANDNDIIGSYPANYANVISVGSSDASDLRSSFSNYGEKTVGVFAPGTAILSTYPNGQYRVLSGTSMATPQVAGAVALAVSLRPGLTQSQVAEDLCDSAVNRLTDVSRCGRVDVAQFLKRVSTR